MDVASWNHAMIAGLMMARGQQRNSLLVSSRAHGFFSNVCVQTQAFLLYAVRNTLGRHIMVGEKYLLPTPLWLIPWNVVGQRSVHCIWICQKIVFRPFDPVNISKTRPLSHVFCNMACDASPEGATGGCKTPCLCVSNSGFWTPTFFMTGNPVICENNPLQCKSPFRFLWLGHIVIDRNWFAFFKQRPPWLSRQRGGKTLGEPYCTCCISV